MTRLTIIPGDNAVYIDGVALHVDCSDFPERGFVNVVQWDDESKTGWIEFVNDGHGPFMRNVSITELAPEYSVYIDRWNQAKAAITVITQARQ